MDWDQLQAFIDSIPPTPDPLPADQWLSFYAQTDAMDDETAGFAIEHLYLRKPAGVTPPGMEGTENMWVPLEGGGKKAQKKKNRTDNELTTNCDGDTKCGPCAEKAKSSASHAKKRKSKTGWQPLENCGGPGGKPGPCPVIGGGDGGSLYAGGRVAHLGGVKGGATAPKIGGGGNIKGLQAGYKKVRDVGLPGAMGQSRVMKKRKSFSRARHIKPDAGSFD